MRLGPIILCVWYVSISHLYVHDDPVCMICWHVDPLNTMFRTTSDHSIGGDSDENIMEGGVTIMETIDQKKPVSNKYLFSFIQLLCGFDAVTASQTVAHN